MEFKRDKYLNQLIEKKNNSLIKVITGARRCGKSYLLNNIYFNYLISIGVKETNIIKFSFDDDEDIDLLEDYFKDEPTKIYKRNGQYTINSRKFRAYIKDATNDIDDYYLFLDEIQILDSFVGTLNAFLNHSNFDCYVTGSNSELLSSNIETKFRGRKSSVNMLPLSFSEFMSGFDIPYQEAYKKYIVTGGIPIVYKQNENDRMNYLEDLSYEVYLKDIIGNRGLKDSSIISEVYSVLASSIGSYLSPSSLERTFKSVRNKTISDDTINNYINYFIDSFVISKAKKYNIKGKAYINAPYKIYFEDIGVRNASLGFKQIEETHIMENIIYNELRYHGFKVDVGEIDYNEKTDKIDKNGKNIYTRKQLEVDFIATKNLEKYYIQSCLNINTEEILKREKRSLYYINDSFKKIIITKDGLDKRIDENGFIIIDLFDFLLNENVLSN